jgi:hypothetical protein
MIKDQLETLKELREALKGDSCIPKGAFLELGNNPQDAPKLNYNLPQSTAFQSYGHINIPIDVSVFKGEVVQIPSNNIFDKISKLDKATATKKLLQSNTLAERSVAVNKEVAEFEVSEGKSASPDTTVVTRNMSFASQDFTQNAALQVAEFVDTDKVPIVVDKFGGFSKEIVTIQRPQDTTPRIFVIEEYTTASYLGDYGAGKVLNTFSLLPGEKNDYFHQNVSRNNHYTRSCREFVR